MQFSLDFWLVVCVVYKILANFSINKKNKAIFKSMSKVVRDTLGFALLRSVIGSENSHHFLNQSDAKLKLNGTWCLAFSCALGALYLPSVLIGSLWYFLIVCCDYHPFGFTTFDRNALLKPPNLTPSRPLPRCRTQKCYKQKVLSLQCKQRDHAFLVIENDNGAFFIVNEGSKWFSE